MSAHDRKSRLMGLGVFLLPLLLVKGTALMVGQPPQGAAASGGGGSSDPDGVIVTYTPQWSLDQIAAAHWVADLGELPFGSSPLLHARTPDEVDPVIIVRDKPITPPDVVVTAILRSRRGNIALIDRDRYRTGDSIEENGWIVQQIDADTRSVLLVHPASGMEATLVVPMPR